MVLPVVKYGDPVLRQRGKRIEGITPDIRAFAADMLETMRAANGVGLAAHQVGQALMLTVIEVRDADQPSILFIEEKHLDVGVPKPMVLVNPLVTEAEGEQIAVEGCLSFPGISADIRRAEAVTVTAMDLNAQPLRFRCAGLLSRVIQHEVDHLDGVLFSDRMDSATKVALSGALKWQQKETQTARKTVIRERSLR